MKMGPGLNAGAMAEVDELRNAANTRYDTRLYFSGVLQFDILGKLGGYAKRPWPRRLPDHLLRTGR